MVRLVIFEERKREGGVVSQLLPLFLHNFLPIWLNLSDHHKQPTNPPRNGFVIWDEKGQKERRRK